MVGELTSQAVIFPEKVAKGVAFKRAVAQLRCLLVSLSSNVSRLNEERHVELLRALFQLSLWRLPETVQSAVADLLVHLTWVRIALQDTCIQFLVRSFCPPVPFGAATQSTPARGLHSPGPAEVAAHTCALNTLNRLILQQPLCTRLVKDALREHMPHRYQPRDRICSYFRALLQLAGVSPSPSARTVETRRRQTAGDLCVPFFARSTCQPRMQRCHVGSSWGTQCLQQRSRCWSK
jgi:hypothetical protein